MRVRLPITLWPASAAALLAPVAVFAALYLLRLTLPRQRLASAEVEVARLREEVAALSGFARGEGPQDHGALMKDEAVAIARRIPLGRHDAEVLDALERLALDTKLGELSIRVQGGLVLKRDGAAAEGTKWMLDPLAPVAAVRSFVVELFFKSGYRDFVAFADRLAELDRFVALESLGVERSSPRAKVDLALRVFYR